MSFAYGHTLWSTIQTIGGDSSSVLCIASPFRWFLQCFPAFSIPSGLRFSFSPSAAMVRMLLSILLKDCACQIKEPFSTTLKFYSSMDVHSIFFFPLTEDKSHWGSEQFNFVYAIHWHYSKGSTEHLSDFFNLFLLWMWHLVVFNLICSIWDYPLDTVFIDQTTISYWSLVIWPYFLLLYIHYLLTSVLTGELPGHTHKYLIEYLELFLIWTKLEKIQIWTLWDITYFSLQE